MVPLHPHQFSGFLSALALLLHGSVLSLAAQEGRSIDSTDIPDSTAPRAPSSHLFLGAVVDLGESAENGGSEHYGFGRQIGSFFLPIENIPQLPALSAGISLSYGYRRSSRMTLSLQIHDHSGRYQEESAVHTGSSNHTVISTMETNFLFMNIGVLASQSIFSIGSTPISLSPGLILQIPLSATEHRTVDWDGLDDQSGMNSFVRDTFPTGSTENSVELRSPLLAVQLGLGPDIWINDDLRFSPYLMARASMSGIVDGTDWRIAMIGLSLEGAWRL